MKVCVVTGSRAEYGLFYPLLKKLKADRAVDLLILATGMHLSAEFGLTYREIEKDGFRIEERVEMLLGGDSPVAAAKSVGLGVIGMSQALARLRPDIVLLLGDRFETFAAAVSAHLTGIPLAHIHGGELTEGAFDDAFRHSITKMSYLHFTCAEEYRKRVIQLGEAPERVFNVGALGIDNIRHTKLLAKGRLEEELGFKFDKKTALVTFHPVTLDKTPSVEQFRELLKALDAFRELDVIFTKPNADPEGRALIRLMDDYADRNAGRVKAFASLGRIRYLSLLRYVDVVIGNSSSGIIEAPFFGHPVLNIGDRQRGRIRPSGVIDCNHDANNLKSALRKALLFDAAGRAAGENPYGDGNAAGRILRILKREVPGIKGAKKSFHDVPFAVK